MNKSVSVLGSTGSIGIQTLEVARKLNLEVTSLCVHSSIDLLEEQIREFHPKRAAVFDEWAKEKMKEI